MASRIVNEPLHRFYSGSDAAESACRISMIGRPHGQMTGAPRARPQSFKSRPLAWAAFSQTQLRQGRKRKKSGTPPC